MKNSERNRAVLENFILHLTHCSDGDHNENTKMEFTPKQMYNVLDDYIKEDHVDGEGREDDATVDVRLIRKVGVKIPVNDGYYKLQINLDKDEPHVMFHNNADADAVKGTDDAPWVEADSPHLGGGCEVGVSYTDENVFDDVNHDIKKEMMLGKPKKFRVFAEVSSRCYIDIEADSEEDALAKAEDIDGGEFISDEQSGDWSIYQATKIS